MQDIPKDTIIAASEGNIEAFERIYRLSSSYVYTVAFRVINSREDAEEVTQEVFIRIYRKLKNFRFKSSFKTWLYRITVNTAINFYNKRKKDTRRIVNLHSDEDASRTVEDLAAPEKKQDIDNEELINRLLDLLNPDQRACIILNAVHGMSYEEIAKTLKVKVNTVKTRIKRAREKMLRGGKGS